MVWNNNVIAFATHEEVNKNENDEYVRTIKVLRIFAPKLLEQCDDEIINMIKEGLLGFHFGPRRPNYNFEFKYKPQYILEGDEYKNQTFMFRLSHGGK